LRDSERRREALHAAAAEAALPPDAFQLPGAEPALLSALLRIGLNASLQPTSQLRMALRLVQKFYRKRNAAIGAALDQALSENQDLSGAFSRFVTDASIALTDAPACLAEFLTGDGGCVLIDEITRLKQESAALRYERDEEARALAAFAQTFNGDCRDSSGLFAQIREVKAALEALKRKASAQKRRLKAARDARKRSADEIASLQRQLEKREQLEHELAFAPGAIEQNEGEAGICASSDLATQLNADVEEWRARYADLLAAKENDEREIAVLTGQLEALQAANAQTEADIEEARQAHAEPRAITDAQEAAIAQLRQELAEARADIERLSAPRECDCGVQQAIARLEKEKRRAIEREKTIAESAVQAAKVSAESYYYERLEEQRMKADGEKRSFCASAINTFRDFFDPTDPLTECTVRAVLQSVKKEFDRLATADYAIRKMLALPPRQRTDDAVAQLLLKRH
jgi:hypothetical protein